MNKFARTLGTRAVQGRTWHEYRKRTLHGKCLGQYVLAGIPGERSVFKACEMRPVKVLFKLLERKAQKGLQSLLSKLELKLGQGCSFQEVNQGWDSLTRGHFSHKLVNWVVRSLMDKHIVTQDGLWVFLIECLSLCSFHV